MGADGAHLGIDAEQALGLILGGGPGPAQDECADAASTRRRILAAADRGGEPHGYGDCADMVAGMVLRFYEAHPEAFDWPASQAGDSPDLYAEVDAMTEGKLSALGITGFQWGWAVNAARFAESLPAEPNPAIIEVRTT